MSQRDHAAKLGRLLLDAAETSEEHARHVLEVMAKSMAQYKNPLTRAGVQSAEMKKDVPVKRQLKWKGFTIHIEKNKGEMRHGRELPADYGYIAATHALDGDGIDVFIGPRLGSCDQVYVVRQLGGKNFDTYDEDKVMLGFASFDDAKRAFCEAQQEKRFGGIAWFTVQQFVDAVEKTKAIPQPVGGFYCWDLGQHNPQVNLARAVGEQIYKLLENDPSQPEDIAVPGIAEEQEALNLQMYMCKGEDSFKPPAAVQAAARRGLALRKQHGKGGLTTQEAGKQGIGSGVQRASDLSGGEALSLATVKRMHAFFSRFKGNRGKEGWGSSTNPSKAWIAWLLWGGDAGQEWAAKIVKDANESK